MIKKSLPFVQLPDVKEAEAVFCRIICNSTAIITGCVYRSPDSNEDCVRNIHEFLQNHAPSLRIIIMGDFNLPDINWNTKEYSSHASEALIDLMLNFSLEQVVSQTTRSQGTANNILDLILLSDHFQLNTLQTGIIEGISDHDIPICHLPLSCSISKRSFESKIIDFEKSNDAGVLTSLAHEFTSFSEFASDPSADINVLWIKFKGIIHDCITKFIPLKTRKPRKYSPWVTREVIHAKRKVKRLRRSLKHTESQSVVKSKLIGAKQELKQKLNQSRKQYFNTILPDFLKNNPQRFWNHFRARNTLAPERTHDENAVQADVFNKYFQSVFTTDNGFLPSVVSTGSSIDPLIISDSGILNLLLGLDAKKSSGPDNVPNEFLKRYAEWCSRYLGIIYRFSLSTARVPNDWRKAKVIPIHKSGDINSPSNYRPISLTSTSCKILEHIILKHLTVYLEQNRILTPSQHGFRRGMSTVTQLTEVVHDLAQIIDNRGQTDIIFLDFSKAFDRVCHNKLIAKLEAIIGIGNISAWIGDFLSQRSQFVHFNEASSDIVPISSGVPQGSVLGPLLFLIYINDIITNMECNIKLFADDCIIYKEILCYEDHHTLNRQLNVINTWCEQWQMSINTSKSVSMTVTKKKNPSEFTYSLNDTELTKVYEHKYLGLTLATDLKWNKHIANISSKAIRKLFFLKRCLKSAPTPIKLLSYTTFVRPVLEYANTVWFPHNITNINQLEKVQRKAIRFIHNKYKRTDSPTELLASSGLDTLACRARQARLKFMHSLLHNHFNIISSKYITFSRSRISRNKHDKMLTEYFCNSNTFKYSFFPTAVREWNNLDPTVAAIESSSIFCDAIGNKPQP